MTPRPPAVSFLEFAHRAGVRLTPGQRALVAVLFDGMHPDELPGDLRSLARELFGAPGSIPARARHVVATVAGARSGKTYVLVGLRALHLALTVPLDSLAPGEVAFGLIVAPDLRLARQALRFAAGAARGDPSLASMIAGDTADALAIRRPDGRVVEIACLPASEAGKTLRGRTLVFAMFDESAFFTSGPEFAISDVELFRAVVARVVPDGQVGIVSTPWAQSGLLFELHRDNFGSPTSALVAHAPTLLLRDDAHTRSIVERERQRDPVNAAREFDAEFGQNDEALLDPADVDAAVRDYDERYRAPGTRYAAAIDLATRHDFSVFVAGHRELRAREAAPAVDVVVVDAARHWAPSVIGRVLKRKVDVEELETEIAQLASHYRARVAADSWGFDFFQSRMRERGVALEQASMAPGDQTRRASLLSAYFRQHRIVIPDNAEMARQLKALRVTRTPGGHMRFAAANRRGQHDDYPKALMLLIEHAVRLPPSGGDVVRRYGADGRARWFARQPNGGLVPTEPPIDSRDWLELCDRAEREGFRTPGIEAWLADPANVETLNAWRRRRRNGSAIGAIVSSR